MYLILKTEINIYALLNSLSKNHEENSHRTNLTMEQAVSAEMLIPVYQNNLHGVTSLKIEIPLSTSQKI
jgi:hypothetical protein